MRFRHPITVEVARTQYDDRTGDPLPSPVRFTIDGCAVAPRTTGEQSDLGTSVVVGLALFAPYGADIRSTDVIRLPDDADPWEVDGEAGHWRSPFTDWRPGSHVALTRQKGA